MENMTLYWILRLFGMKLALALALSLAAAAPARAAESAAFLKNNMDVRSEAMGGGAEVFTSGAAAAFRNPAGAARAASSELMFSYTQAMLGSSYQGVSYMRAPGSGTSTHYKVSASGIRTETRPSRGRTAFGVHAIYHQLGSFQTTDANFNSTGKVRPYNLAAGFTAARPLGFASAGITVKVIHQSLGEESADSAAVDIGVISPTPLRGLSLSASVTNLGTRVRFVSESYSLPTAANLGLGFQTRFVRFTGDFRAPMGGGDGSRFTLGTEFTPVNGLALRAGYLGQPGGAGAGGDGEGSSSGLGFGAGLVMGRYGLDYAVVPTAFDSTNKISLRMSF